MEEEKKKINLMKVKEKELNGDLIESVIEEEPEITSTSLRHLALIEEDSEDETIPGYNGA